MATKKIGSSLELGTMKRPDPTKKKGVKPKDILIGLLVGYIIGIFVMMIIHFMISKRCVNCGEPGTPAPTPGTELQEECFEGWVILAGEKTCFYDSYFDVNWTIVGPDAGTNKVDEYFQKIGSLQDIDDDILIGAVFSNNKGFYQWTGTTPVPTPQTPTTTPAEETCVADLQVTPVEWGLNLLVPDNNDTCFI